jgi:lycopene beta-cyclase
MIQDNDLVILGAGLSGLSLAIEMLKKQPLKILLLEKNTSVPDDRTYCFWQGPDLLNLTNEFKTKPRASWSAIKIAYGDQVHHISIAPYEYVCFEGGHIIQELTEKALAFGAEIKTGIEVTQPIRFDQDSSIISTSEGTMHSLLVADSRPQKNAAFLQQWPNLAQAFIGTEIRCDEGIFNPEEVTLMDFHECDDEIQFTYILPFSEHQALIETTFFSANPDFNRIRQRHDKTLNNYSSYQVVRHEQAILPMAISFNKMPERNVLNIGVGAGAARPSSGYAFTRLGLWRSQLRLLDKPINRANISEFRLRTSRFSLGLDAIFLSALRSNPKAAPSLFVHLFTRTPIASVIRFMSDQPRMIDYCRVMFALPKLPMIKALLVLYVSGR